MLYLSKSEDYKMAYCDYCNKGIGPHSEYEFLFHQLGMFGGHPKCMRSLKIRLDKIQNDKNKVAE